MYGRNGHIPASTWAFDQVKGKASLICAIYVAKHGFSLTGVWRKSINRIQYHE
ncbi:MAG: hypothetical protein ACJA1U_000840 [Bermanella sp.]|jgi:hypothetical protein